MKPNALCTVVGFSVVFSAFAPVAGLCQFTGDRGRPVQQLPMVMKSLIPDILTKGIQTASRPLLRRAFADRSSSRESRRKGSVRFWGMARFAVPPRTTRVCGVA